MTIKRVSTYAYDVEGKKNDYHVRLDDPSNAPGPENPWYVDIFNSREVNNNKAHIRTEEHEALEDAFEFICDAEGEPNEAP